MRLDSHSIWKKLFGRYKEVNFFESPRYKHTFNYPLYSTECLYEKEDGPFNTIFEDLQVGTLFYDFSSANLSALSKRKEVKIDKFELSTTRGSDKPTIGSKLEQFLREGKKVTHIIRTREIYGGDTHYSVWRDYEKAEIYEVKLDGT